MLGCQWVFRYKIDKHGYLQKCKTRLVVYGNQQKYHALQTRATILAITFLHLLLVLTTKFDLEIIQLDIVNVFMHTNLDEMMFMRVPLRYGKNGKVLRLNKVLYGLQRSPLL